MGCSGASGCGGFGPRLKAEEARSHRLEAQQVSALDAMAAALGCKAASSSVEALVSELPPHPCTAPDTGVRKLCACLASDARRRRASSADEQRGRGAAGAQAQPSCWSPGCRRLSLLRRTAAAPPKAQPARHRRRSAPLPGSTGCAPGL